MRPGARRLLVSLCLVSAVTSAACLLVLRSGRPLYYTDGVNDIIATELVDAPMLRYDRPQLVTEIPGPLVGRVQELPDGRLIYGRASGPRRTDLVIFDPHRPELEPVPASILNTSGHELSPALSADGILYFASDRAGGAGGFDIYQALYIEGGLFSVPRPLPETINTSLDEVHPAPDPEGTALVFVRRLPTVDGGKNGHLLIAQLNSDETATPLWKQPRRPLPLIDADPAFSPDGVSLWFVREQAGSAPRLQRSWRHLGKFVDPISFPDLDDRGPFTSPQPSADGFQLGLIKPGDVPLLYLAKATEVYPYWAGQRSLEFFLFLCLLAALFLLMLLLLGARWHQLDFITWCIILSLLLHLLIWMLLSGMEMVQSWAPTPAAEDRLSLRLISMRKGSQSGGGELSQRMDRLSERLTMAQREDRIASETPETALSRDSDRAKAPDANRSEAELRPAQVELAYLPKDASERFAPLNGRESLQRVDPEISALAQAQAEAEGLRAETLANVIEVSSPPGVALPANPHTGSRQVPQHRVRPALQVEQSQRPLGTLADAPQSVDLQPSLLRESLVSATPQSVLPVTAAELPAPVSQRAVANPDPKVMREVARPRPREGMVAATTRALGARRQVDLSRLERGPKTNLDPASDDSLTAPSVHRAVEPAMPALASSSALRALDPERVKPMARRPPAHDGRDFKSAMPAPSATALVSASRRLDRAARRNLALSPKQSQARPALRDAASLASAAREDPRTSADTAPVLEPKVAAVAASMVVLGAQREFRDPPTSSVASIASPGQRELPRPTRRDLARNHRPSLMGLRMRGAPKANLAEDIAEVPSPSPEPTAEPDLPHALAIGSLQMQGPQPDDLPRPIRGGEQDEGPALVSSGLRLPGSFLTLAPRRDDVKGSSLNKVESLYSNRFGPRKTEALARFGGTKATERAVEGGLAYLAGIQKRAGYWGSRRRSHEKYGEVYIGKTALCMLAFLGAGHTHRSGSEYSEVVARAIDFLLAQQDEETGQFGRRSSAYSHGISTYALAECLAITGDPRLKRPISLAVTRILSAQSKSSDRRNRGGWGYFSPTLSPEDPYARTSVSAWMVMALKSAELSGIGFPDSSKKAIKAYLWRMYDRDRRYFLYSKDPSRLRSAWRTLPASTPAGVFSLLLLGEDSSDARLRGALQFTTDRAPKSYRRGTDDDFVLRATGNVYFWYYGSLACFMAGGDSWKRWNQHLRTVLPRAQNLDGSFSPIGAYASYAGDTRQDMSYTTAMVVLSLEVYYRYLTPLLEGR